MPPTRLWTHELAQLRSRASKLAPRTANNPLRQIVDDTLEACAELIGDLGWAQTECEDSQSAVAAVTAVQQRLFELNPCPAVTTDRFGTIVQANGAAAALLNLGAKRLEGRPLLLYTAQRETFRQ